MDRTPLRRCVPVALLFWIGCVLLTGSAFAATGNESVSPSQPEYTLGDTAVIYGSGFAPGSSVIVEVIRANGYPTVTGNGTETPGSDTVTVSASGTFTYLYLIDGGPTAAYDGTLTVNARDASTLVVLATTSFIDGPQFHFQGCSKDRGDCTLDNPATGWADGIGPMTGWTSGDVKGWFELDNVPYRLRIGLRDPAPTGISIYVMNEHDNLKSGVPGIDSATNFYVGAGPSASGYTEGELTKTCTFQTTRLVGDVPTVGNPCIVTGPTYTDFDDDGNGGDGEDAVDGIDNDGDGRIDEDPPRQGGSDKRIQYVWAVLFDSSEAGDSDKKWALYWTGHLASGSSAFPGSSLHSNTTKTGNKNVPIEDIEASSPSGADLSITKTAAPNPMVVDQSLTYTVTVTNNGPSTATGVTVSDTLPPGVTFISVDPGSPTCTQSAGLVMCDLGSLANGATATVTIVVTPPFAGSLTNTAGVSNGVADPDSNNNTSATTTLVNPEADPPSTCSVTKDFSELGVLGNEGTSYSVDSDLTLFARTAIPPAGSALTGGSTGTIFIGQLGTMGAAGDILNCPSPTDKNCGVGVQDSGAGGSKGISGEGGDQDESLIFDFASPVIASSVKVGLIGLNCLNGTSGTNCTQNDVITLEIDFTVGPDQIIANANAAVTLSGSPESLGTLDFSSLGLPAGSQIDRFAIRATEGHFGVTNIESESCVSADLAITKSGPSSAIVGQAFTYTIGVSNAGPSPASGVTVTDNLPGGVTYGSGSWTGASSGTCTFATPTVTCTIGTLASGASVTITITVTPTATGTLSNSASVDSTTGDPNAGNDTTPPVSTTVGTSADLAITKSGPSSATVGQPFTYTIGVSNGGPSPASGVTVTDNLPGGVTYGSGTWTGASSGTCTFATPTVTCTIGTLASGASVTITITVTPTATGTLSNSASVDSTTGDPNAGNDTTPAVMTTVTSAPSTGPLGGSAFSNAGGSISSTNYQLITGVAGQGIGQGSQSTNYQLGAGYAPGVTGG